MAYFRPLTFFLYWFLNNEVVHVYKNIMESGGEMDWEFGISRCKLLYGEWMKKVLLIAQGTIFSIL